MRETFIQPETLMRDDSVWMFDALFHRSFSDFVPQNLALSEENDRFSAPLELSGNTGEVSGRGSNLHETESEVGEAVHETKSESVERFAEGLLEGLRRAAAVR